MSKQEDEERGSQKKPTAGDLHGNEDRDGTRVAENSPSTEDCQMTKGEQVGSDWIMYNPKEQMGSEHARAQRHREANIRLYGTAGPLTPDDRATRKMLTDMNDSVAVMLSTFRAGSKKRQEMYDAKRKEEGQKEDKTDEDKGEKDKSSAPA